MVFQGKKAPVGGAERQGSMFLLNAFSVSMVADGATVEFIPLSEGEAKDKLVQIETLDRGEGRRPAAWLSATSAVGHADTAAVLATILGVPVPTHRVSVALASGDEAVVTQYVGPRLPEGATALPEGANFSWFLVRVHGVRMIASLKDEIVRLQSRLLDIIGDEGVDLDQE
jgi:hypothetical protein